MITAGSTTALDVAWWIRQRFHDLGGGAVVPAVGHLQRSGVPLVQEGGRSCPPSPYDAVIEPGDLVHCDVGLTSLGLTTDTQRNGYVLRPGEATAPEGLRAALRNGNRMQDLTTAELTAGRTGNEVLAAAREARDLTGIDVDIYSHPSASTATAPAPRSGSGTHRAASRARVTTRSTSTRSTRSRARRAPAGAGVGRAVRAVALEQGIALTADGVEYLDGRQTELILTRPDRPPPRSAASADHFLRASAVFLLFAFWMAPTSSFFFISTGRRRRASSPA